MCDSGECLTVRAREGTSCTNWANRFRIRAVGKLEPVPGIRFESRSLDLEGEVDIVGGERFARINRFAFEAGIVEDFEGNADRDTLIRCPVYWECTGP